MLDRTGALERRPKPVSQTDLDFSCGNLSSSLSVFVADSVPGVFGNIAQITGSFDAAMAAFRAEVQALADSIAVLECSALQVPVLDN